MVESSFDAFAIELVVFEKENNRIKQQQFGPVPFRSIDNAKTFLQIIKMSLQNKIIFVTENIKLQTLWSLSWYFVVNSLSNFSATLDHIKEISPLLILVMKLKAEKSELFNAGRSSLFFLTIV